MKVSCRRLEAALESHLIEKEGNRNGVGGGEALLGCQHKASADPTGSSGAGWSCTVVPTLYLALTSHWIQAGPEGSVTLGKAAPFGKGQLLERGLTESLQQTTLLAAVGMRAVVLKGGSAPHIHHTEFPGLIIFISIYKNQCSLNSG